MEITLEDVEIAIRILTEFLKRQRQAQSLLSRFGVQTRSGGMSALSFEQFVNLAYQEVMAKKKIAEGGEAVEPEPTVSDEDVKRMREIAQKLKSKPQ